MTAVLNGTICDDANLSVADSDDRLFLGQLSGKMPDSGAIEALRGTAIPITGYKKELSLRAHWRFGPSSSGRYLRTEWSEFALLAYTNYKPTPFVRLEVEATRDPDAWNVAHLQVHGESQVLGQIWGVTKARNPKQLSKLHLPGFSTDRASRTSSSSSSRKSSFVARITGGKPSMKRDTSTACDSYRA